MRWGWVLVLGSWGVVMGLLTSLVGLSPTVEPFAWFGAYAIWLVVIHWRRLPPFQTGLASSLLSGVWVGAVQALLQGPYRANNPAYAEVLQGSSRETAMAFLAQGIVAGFLFGLGVGGLALALAWIRDRRAPASPRGAAN